MDLSHLQHRDQTAWRLMRAGSLGCLSAAGVLLLGTLVASAAPRGTAMSTVHMVFSTFGLG